MGAARSIAPVVACRRRRPHPSPPPEGEGAKPAGARLVFLSQREKEEEGAT